ncbi:MAG: cupin domain-containing protein [Gemmataceae bacterium]
MNSCEIPPCPGSQAQEQARISEAGSRLHRLLPTEAGLAWSGVPVQEYKPTAAHHCGVRRLVLVGETGEKTAFHLRYFEIAPGGFTTLEHHRHEHVVIVLRGSGLARIADQEHVLTYGDTLYIAPHEVHQLRNPSADEPFGFLCLVDAVRDRPIVVADNADQASTCESSVGVGPSITPPSDL